MISNIPELKDYLRSSIKELKELKAKVESHPNTDSIYDWEDAHQVKTIADAALEVLEETLVLLDTGKEVTKDDISYGYNYLLGYLDKI